MSPWGDPGPLSAVKIRRASAGQLVRNELGLAGLPRSGAGAAEQPALAGRGTFRLRVSPSSAATQGSCVSGPECLSLSET